MSNLQRGADIPVRHSELNGHSECNGGLENPPSVEADYGEIGMKVEKVQFPSDWMISSVAESFDFTKKPRGLDLSKYGAEIPFFPMEKIPLGRICVSEFLPKPFEKLGSGTYVENGDLMVAKITPSFENGKQAIVDINTDFAYATTEVIPIRGREGVSDTLFLFFYLLHPEVRADLAGKMEGSTGRQRLSKTVLGDLLLPLPPLPEQKKIAHILSTVQRAIEAQERIIQTTTELKKALMHKLFTEGLRNEPQKETEIGLVPESWEVCNVGDIAKIQSGGTPSRDVPENWRDGTIPWVKTGEINYYVINDTEEKITTTGLANSAARLFPAGTLLMAMYGQGITRGKVGLLGIEAATNQACASIIPTEKERISSVFLYYYFEYHYEKLRQLGHGANQRNMNAALIRSFPLSFPKPDEQATVVTVFASLDEKRGHHECRKTQLQDLFRTLLHELMTAKTLVHELEITV